MQIGAAEHEAVGICMFDGQEVYIESKLADGDLELSMKHGLDINRHNEAVLVLFTEGMPTLLDIDNNNSTEYWQKDTIGH
ncbi:MAG: hypothetical protein JNM49_10220 [Flavobacteriales bacterium]|nr:hypothetical protein [Flavobacteriales bacterium]